MRWQHKPSYSFATTPRPLIRIRVHHRCLIIHIGQIEKKEDEAKTRKCPICIKKQTRHKLQDNIVVVFCGIRGSQKALNIHRLKDVSWRVDILCACSSPPAAVTSVFKSEEYSDWRVFTELRLHSPTHVLPTVTPDKPNMCYRRVTRSLSKQEPRPGTAFNYRAEMMRCMDALITRVECISHRTAAYDFKMT